MREKRQLFTPYSWEKIQARNNVLRAERRHSRKATEITPAVMKKDSAFALIQKKIIHKDMRKIDERVETLIKAEDHLIEMSYNYSEAGNFLHRLRRDGESELNRRVKFDLRLLHFEFLKWVFFGEGEYVLAERVAAHIFKISKTGLHSRKLQDYMRLPATKGSLGKELMRMDPTWLVEFRGSLKDK